MIRALAIPLLIMAVVAGCKRQPDGAISGTDVARSAAFWKEVAGIRFTEDRSHRGDLLPADALTDAQGRVVTLASLRGRPVLVNLWAHWCVPCRAEMPTLGAMAAARADTLTVVALNEDGVRPSATSLGPLPLASQMREWRDPAVGLGRSLGGGGLPTTVLYGSDGRERWRLVGVLDWGKPQAQALLHEAT